MVTSLANLSDRNYAESPPFYRVWFGVGLAFNFIGRTTQHDEVASDRIFRVLWNHKKAGSTVDPENSLTYSNAHLIVRFANDVESDHVLAAYSSGLLRRLCTESLREFFRDNVNIVWFQVNRQGDSRARFLRTREPRRTSGQPRMRGGNYDPQPHLTVTHLSP